jgi:hypothetical protein
VIRIDQVNRESTNKTGAGFFTDFSLPHGSTAQTMTSDLLAIERP